MSREDAKEGHNEIPNRDDEGHNVRKTNRAVLSTKGKFGSGNVR